MVYLDGGAGGYTMVALNGLAKLERQDKGAGSRCPVKPLLPKSEVMRSGQRLSGSIQRSGAEARAATCIGFRAVSAGAQ